MNLIEAHDLYRFYHADSEEILALRGVSLGLNPGEMLAIQGPSGSGKSTLLACLSGLDEPDGGRVWIAENALTRKSEAVRQTIRRRYIGILLQSGNLFSHLKVEQNLELFLTLKGHSRRRIHLETLLNLVGLTERRLSYPSQLSGGESARAGLAVALVNSPAVLMADEPTGEVDAETEQFLLSGLSEFCRHGGAVVVATHSREVAKKANRVLEMSDGRIV